MVHILVRHKVKDYDQWRKVFYEHLLASKPNGSQGGYIFRNKHEKNEVFVLMKWDHMDNFKKFSQSIDPKKTREKERISPTFEHTRISPFS